MNKTNLKLLGLNFYTFEKGKKRLWGKIIDENNQTIASYLKNNPDGYRVILHTRQEVEKWIQDKVIFTNKEQGK